MRRRRPVGAHGRIAASIGACVIMVLVVLLSATPASAHATLVRSEPAANAVLDRDPGQLRLVFTEPVDADLSTVAITVSGVVVATATEADPDDGASLIVVFERDLPDGVAVARWRVLSEADGHVTNGIVVFGIGEDADPTAAVFAEPTNPLDPIDALLRWLVLAGLVLLIGGAWSARWVGIDGSVSSATEPPGRPIRLVGLVAAVSVGVAVMQFVYQVSVIGGPSLTGTAWSLATGRWGLLWAFRLLAIVGLVLVTRSGWARRAPAAGPLAVGTSVVGLVHALSSHAAGVRSLGWVAVAADASHLVAAGIWVGGLVALTVVVWPRFGRDGVAGDDRGHGVEQHWSRAEVAEVWRRFSTPALGSAVVLLASGLFLTGRHTTSFDAVLRSGYGQILLAKVTLVAAVLALGLTNAFGVNRSLPTWLPGLGQARVSQRLGSGRSPERGPGPMMARGEAILGLLVVGAAALLTATPPAVGPDFTPSAEIGPDTRSAQVGDVLVGLSIKPNRPGQNLLIVQAASTVRPAPAPIERVLARLQFDGDDRGRETLTLEPTADGTWELLDPSLSSPGQWGIDIVVRRAGLVDQEATFGWTVPTRAVEEPIVSDARWSGLLSAMALGVAGLGLAMVGSTVRAARRSKAAPVAAVALIVAVATVVRTEPAAAHADWASSDPVPCATIVGGTVDSISIGFTEEVDAARSSFTLTDATGLTLAEGALDLDDLDRRTIALEPARPLGPGSYRVEWTSASAQDGDVASAGYGFAIGQAAPSDCALASVDGQAVGEEGGRSPTMTVVVIALVAVCVGLGGRLVWQLRRRAVGPVRRRPPGQSTVDPNGFSPLDADRQLHRRTADDSAGPHRR